MSVARTRVLRSALFLVAAAFAAFVIQACDDAEDDAFVPDGGGPSLDATAPRDGANGSVDARTEDVVRRFDASGADANADAGAVDGGADANVELDATADADAAADASPDAADATADASADATVDASVDATVDAGAEVDAGDCTGLPLTATDKPLLAAAPPAPNASGVAITAGTYDISTGFSYTNASAPGTTVGTLDAVTLRFNANGTYEAAHKDGSKSRGTWSVAGTNLSISIQCPGVVGPIVRPFTADSTTLRLFFVGASSSLEHVYAKRP